jgi:hypothetical protein
LKAIRPLVDKIIGSLKKMQPARLEKRCEKLRLNKKAESFALPFRMSDIRAVFSSFDLAKVLEPYLAPNVYIVIS